MKSPLRTGSGLLLAGAVLAAAVLVRPVRAAAQDQPPDAREMREVLDKGIAYLRKSQNEDGSFAAKKFGPGPTALVVAALLRNGVSADDPVVARAISYLESKVQKNGGIYDRVLANYTTSVALMAFTEANTGKNKGKYDALIKDATEFIKKLQYDDPTVNDKDPRYGGVGYDGKSRPDLSNTQYFLDALQAAGVGKDDPAVQRAIKFVSRCQNLPGETTDQPFAKKTTPDDKGGLTYTPIDPEESQYKNDAGGLRSLGAMTYAGLKSFLFAGVGKDDPRVKGAIGWIRAHYTLDENPGEGQSGLYYYYHTFAKAMTALGEDPFVEKEGTKHHWRRELFEALKKRQAGDGSWVNKDDKAFGESTADLSTGFALLTLSCCKAPAK